MAVNKVEYGGETLIDLTGDSVTPETLLEGATAHSANGEKITGTLSLKDTLIVTIDLETNIASHTAQQIYDYVANGGSVVLSLPEEYIPLSEATPYTVYFSYITDDYFLCQSLILEDGTYYYQETDLANNQNVNAMIEEAIANLPVYDGTCIDVYDGEIEDVPTEQPILPTEYQRVEYLESTGKEWIDTGVLATETTDFEFVGAITENTKTGWIVGAPTWVGIHKKAGTVAVTQTSSGHTYLPVNVNEVFTLGLFGDKAYFNGVETNTLARKKATTSLFMFAYHHTNDTGSISTAVRIYSFKIWENGDLIREYVPCYRKSDDKPGMYDLVTKTFSTNAGTGEFVCGGNLEDGVMISFKIAGSVQIYKAQEGMTWEEWVNSAYNIGYNTDSGLFTISIYNSGIVIDGGAEGIITTADDTANIAPTDLIIDGYEYSYV